MIGAKIVDRLQALVNPQALNFPKDQGIHRNQRPQVIAAREFGEVASEVHW